MRLTPETLPVVSVTTGHADKGGKTLVLVYSKEIKGHLMKMPGLTSITIFYLLKQQHLLLMLWPSQQL